MQSPGLDITEVEDGLVVFEPVSRRVHHLNVTATLVFELCTGENDRDTMVQLVQSAFGLSEPPVAEIDDLLALLTAEALVFAGSSV